MKILLSIVAVAALAGCATPANKVGASYTSPLVFQSYTCEQLASETYRIGSRLNSMGVSVDKQAKQDKWAMGVGLVLFWPALFMVDGDDNLQVEFARLKGEYEAIQQAASLKGCVGQGPAQLQAQQIPDQGYIAQPAVQVQQPNNPQPEAPAPANPQQKDWRKWKP